MSSLKIVRVDPEPRQFSVVWMLGSRCNYDCMYCPAELHDKTSSHHGLETLQKVWQQIVSNTQHLGLGYKIAFTGGEVTTNRSFLPLIEWIRSHFPHTQFFVTTNGSASLKYYQRLAKAVNGITLSTHSEFMDERKFFIIARELNKIMTRPEKSLHVNIMDEYWNTERTPTYERFCKEHGISYTMNSINYANQTRINIKQQGKQNIETI